jgi:hypothetical protein
MGRRLLMPALKLQVRPFLEYPGVRQDECSIAQHRNSDGGQSTLGPPQNLSCP